MPFKAVTTQSTTQSLLPIYGGKKTQYIFWDAIQLSSTMREYSDLEFERYLGEGATFTVNLHREAATAETEPKFVAVKTAKLSEASYTSDGPGVDLSALLLEIQIPQYEPLQNHPNIIDILGMDWTVIGNGVPAPRLIVEYAKFGTMSDYLQVYSIGIREKIDLCLDVASGLEMIHRCGVIHGDMKLPNILVFEVEGRRVAKISDFGCALTSAEIEEGQRYRGTRSYRAPELKDDPALTMEDLRRCDVYAFGLCVWEILKDGQHYSESEASTLGAGKPLPDLFDMFLETALRDAPPTSMGLGTLAMDESGLGKFNSVDGTKISLKGALHNLVHHSIHPVAAKRYTMEAIVKMFQRLVVQYDVFPYGFLG
jgi:serine/threonine protein kinase